jgi:tripeptide aminopeptidase
MVDKREEVIQMFLDLVKIDSPSGEEENLRLFIVKELQKMGIKSEVDKVGNLFAKVAGRGESVVLCAHMDTVEPGRGIRPIVQDGVIKSDGSTILGADNKVTIAAILSAISGVNKEKVKPVEIIFTVREETDGGVNEFNFKKLRSKFGLVADRSSSVGSIVLASPWIVNLKIVVNGKASHSGMPEDGINALTFAVAALKNIKVGRVDKETTINFGLINGGSAMNTVPHKVTVLGEIRSFSKARLDKALIEVKRAFEKEIKTGKAELEFESNLYCVGYEYKKEDKAVQLIRRAGEKLGLKTEYGISFGGSDANTFHANGIQMVNVGDGTKLSHTVDEQVGTESLSGLEKLISLYILNE